MPLMKCPRDFFGLGSVQHKSTRALRVTHGYISTTTDAYALPLGAYTIVHWKCNECGETWTERKEGEWVESDFS